MTDVLEELRDRVEEDRDQALRAALDLQERAGSDPQVDAELEFALSRVDQLGRRLQALPEVKVIRERPIYGPGSERQYFADLAMSCTKDNQHQGAQAAERLKHHDAAEGRMKEDDNEQAFRMLSREGWQLERGSRAQTRATSMLAGAGGEFSPPTTIIERFASVARSAAPLLRLADHSLPLPDGVDSIWIPRFTSYAGLAAQGQDEQNTNVGDDYSETDKLVCPVVSIIGGAEVSLQFAERMPLRDEVVSAEFAEAYAAMAEEQMFTGAGGDYELEGLLELDGINVETYTPSDSPVPTGVVTGIGQTAAAIGDTRLRMPDAVLMRPARLSWLMAATDGSGYEPTSRPGTGEIPSNADAGPYGPVAGLPVYPTAGLPNDYGTGTDQDPIVVLRAKDLMVLESEPKFVAYLLGGTGSQMTAWLGWYRYLVFVSGRYPEGVGVLTGSGLSNPLSW